MSDMSSMMGGMMAYGWIAALVVLALVVAGVMALIKTSPGGGVAANAILVVLAVIGGVALVGVTVMALMHAGGMACCS